MQSAAPFEVGRVYRRRDLHAEYGGQQQGGIVTPRDQPFIFCITGESGAAYGYADETDDEGVLHYFGEGQRGDMSFVRGNGAIRDHAQDGRALYVFELARPGHLRFRGEYVCAGYEDREALDVSGETRRAIVFQLVPLDAAREGDGVGDEAEAADSLDELRDAALEQPTASAGASEAKRRAWVRSAKLRLYVRARAAGSCEGCGQPAPFNDRQGNPYLEPHHTRRLSDGGPDHPRWVIALCPTCHSRVHYGEDGEDFNHTLMGKLGDLEA